MRAAKILTVVMAATLAAASTSTTSLAFHAGGVAECEGCHSMHAPDPAGEHLLVGDTTSATCLVCHGASGAGSYHIATPPTDLGPGSAPYNITPGGDFGWLEKTYIFVVDGAAVTEDGNSHGHDINAGAFAAWGIITNNATSPGGTYAQSDLGCPSCHDPHGTYRRTSAGTIVQTGFPIKGSGSYPGPENDPTTTEAVGVYRLLAGSGYETGALTYSGVPAAKVPLSYNRSESTTQTRVAYGVATTGGHISWGDWCATCHGAMHSEGGSNYVHAVDESLGSIGGSGGLYGLYVKSGDMTGGFATSFLSLVPFATNSSDYTGVLAPLAVNDDTQLGGPEATDQVTCLSCHRAHASGFRYMLRFGYDYAFMTMESQYAFNSAVGRGRIESEMEIAYGGRPATRWATYQRVLCNKCHAKD
ncbi:MAG: cytochrome C [Deltaproteobacteria bacterium]|nr:MAG: cytochrome C [Deltaproteobacteria bacterium]